jgi:hypothetical protein
MGSWSAWIVGEGSMFSNEVVPRPLGRRLRVFTRLWGMKEDSSDHDDNSRSSSLRFVGWEVSPVIEAQRSVRGYVVADCEPQEQNDCHLGVEIRSVLERWLGVLFLGLPPPRAD